MEPPYPQMRPTAWPWSVVEQFYFIFLIFFKRVCSVFLASPLEFNRKLEHISDIAKFFKQYYNFLNFKSWEKKNHI
jgi:hypothetical protein